MHSTTISNPTADTRLIVVMGVSGCGKTSVASALAAHYGFRYLDADDFHSESARAHMASGQPLTDEMRAPWVTALQQQLRQQAAAQESCTLAFSGLRHLHREQIRAAGLRTLVILLSGEPAIIQDRLEKRTDHFMDPALLSSQFASLEDTSNEADIIILDIAAPLTSVVAAAIAAIAQLPFN